MVYGCGNNTIKILVFIVNFLICVAGGAVMGVGIWANVDDSFTKALTDAGLKDVDVGQFTIAIWVLVGIGGFLFLTGFLGCCGAACENRLLLGLFFAIVLVLFVAELGAAIAAIVMKDKAKDALESGLKKEIAKNPKAIDGLQTQNCVEVGWTYIKDNAVKAGGVGIGVLVIELLAMIFSCIMCNAISQKSSYKGYA